MNQNQNTQKQIIRILKKIKKYNKKNQLKIIYNKQINNLKNNYIYVKNNIVNKFLYIFFNLKDKNNEKEWFNISLESMKKNEISYFCVEYIKMNENNKKQIEQRKHYLVHLQDFKQISDIKTNGKILKKILQKGQGKKRPQKQDEIKCKQKIKKYQNKNIYVFIYYKKKLIINQVKKMEKQLMKGKIMKQVLRSMKEQEIAVCEIFQQAFQEYETSLKYKEQFINSDDQSYILEINLKKLIQIQDIFQDEMAIKKIQKEGTIIGSNNQKLEKICRVYFSLKIEVFTKIIYESPFCEKELSLENDENQIQLIEKENFCLKYYLDEYNISKLLKNALRLMKKQEESIIICKDNKLIKYGIDYNIIKQNFNQLEFPQEVIYHIKLYNFTQGLNTFSMNIQERILHAQRKKIIGLKLIKVKKQITIHNIKKKENNYRKALKTFESINAFFDLGKYEGQDAIDIYQVKKKMNQTKKKKKKIKSIKFQVYQILHFVI
ncbi:hypothetical protein IMG5_045880 [Ichthyophthirius multifiliis]|uniref:Uncharacterized protein n=1 Tax=Ichthyophthirius multifiliis TaxID=5932 RepID=G0QM70_ICHMU|nr:hypothetical protein IMG5_045880 [Ichthyophthirius multifiliis]EGR33673.1 hypothetical protein IMG5_045880 [Ichthyophthirius multifiliis]|eukprot:XP_004037659.1 hypothetical protein IMG5_045880 [Ichthyophthirius multifiliis]